MQNYRMSEICTNLAKTRNTGAILTTVMRYNAIRYSHNERAQQVQWKVRSRKEEENVKNVNQIVSGLILLNKPNTEFSGFIKKWY